jgi:hypothetical protein
MTVEAVDWKQLCRALVNAIETMQFGPQSHERVLLAAQDYLKSDVAYIKAKWALEVYP